MRSIDRGRAVNDHTATLRVLLIAEPDLASDALAGALIEQRHEVLVRLPPDADYLQYVRRLKPDILIAHMDSLSGAVLDSLRTVSKAQPRPIVVFARDGDRRVISAAVRAGASAYVVDGLHPRRLGPIMDAAIARFREIQALRAELRGARNLLYRRRTGLGGPTPD